MRTSGTEAMPCRALGLWPRSRDKDDAESVRVSECHRVGSPVGVRCLYRLRTDTLACLLHSLGVPEVEDEQRLRMRRGSAMVAAARKFELRACPRQAEEHTVVTVMVVEAAQ